MIKKNKEILTDDQKRKLMKIYKEHTTEEICKIFNLTESQLKGQVTRLGISQR